MPVTPYSYITLAGAQQELANRLYDSAQTFWSPAELISLITEALRAFNAHTSFWRDQFVFHASSAAGLSGSAFYDLTQQSGSLAPFTQYDTNIYTQIQYALLEPTTWNPWTGGSSQFSADDLLQAVQRRRNEILALTGCTLTYRQVPATPGRIVLPDTTLDVRRMAYLQGGLPYGQGAYGSGPWGASIYTGSPMWPEDRWGLDTYQRQWTIQPPGTPFAYTISTEPPLSVDPDRVPANAGAYEFLTVDVGDTFSTSTPSLLYIPDDWTWIIKWGALADLLSRDTLARDTARAAYAEARYRAGIALLATAPAILTAYANNTPMLIDSVRNADLYTTSWEATAGAPQRLLTAGLNLVAPSPSPDANGPYGLTVTVVENSPVPVNSTDYIQASRGDIDAILDYAEHIALFKSGGAEFSASQQLLSRFLKHCAVYNSKLAELGEYQLFLYGRAQAEEIANPRLAAPEVLNAG